MKHRVRGISIYKPASRSKKTDPYLIAFGPKHDRTVMSGSADYGVCVELASKLAAINDRVQHGLTDAHATRYFVQARRDLVHHLDEYERAIVNQGGSQKHATQMRTYAEDVLDTARAIYISDLIPSRLQASLAKIKGSETTRKRHYDALHAFVAWGASDHRWSNATITLLPEMRYQKDPKVRRRVISLELLGHLIDTTENSGRYAERVTGKERALIYLTVAATALRAGEMTALNVGDVGEDGFYVMGKNQVRELIPVPAGLLKQIIGIFDQRAPEAKLFNMPANPARMLRHDLKAAGIPFKTADGVFDFHALRHQSGTILASAGVNPKAIQSHMRHSDIRLTLGTYGHLLDSDRSKAQNAINDVIGRQRPAQRRALSDVPSGSLKGVGDDMENADAPKKPMERRGIEPRFAECDSAAVLANVKSDSRLVNKLGKRIAPRAAQRLLRRLFVRASRRSLTRIAKAATDGRAG